MRFGIFASSSEMLRMRSVLCTFHISDIFQYYEMSYGLNVEMHKQVRQNRPMAMFLRLLTSLEEREAATKNKHGPDMSDL